MRLINKAEKPKLVSILSESFRSNPNILSIIKNDYKVEQRVVALCKFCVEMAFAKKGAYISKNEKGAALLVENDASVPILFKIKQYFNMGQYCVGWDRAISSLKQESLIKSHRIGTNHLYFWMIAIANDDHVYTIKEIKDDLFDISKKLNLPIVAETTLEKNKQIYSKRYGFDLYNKLDFPEKNYSIWFLKREPDSLIGI